MYCIKCGKQIKDDSKFCEFCGANISAKTSLMSRIAHEHLTSSTSVDEKINIANTPIAESATNTTTPAKKKGNICAIVGLISAFLIPLLGWILGGIGLSKSKKTGSGKGVAIAAIIVATIMFVVNLVIIY